jgi:uncharacterized protein
MTEYIIPFSGLKVGEHTFTFTIEKSFLKKFECQEVLDIMLDVSVKMNKNHRLLEFDFFLKGRAVVECDRCLDEFNLPVDYHSRLIVKLEDVEEVEDEIIYLKPDENEIDISRFIYENIIFSIPPRKVHPTDKKGKSLCNPEMLKKLETLLVKQPEENTDPRWNKLKDLLN